MDLSAKNLERIENYKRKGFKVFKHGKYHHTWIAVKDDSYCLWTCFGDLLSRVVLTRIDQENV